MVAGFGLSTGNWLSLAAWVGESATGGRQAGCGTGAANNAPHGRRVGRFAARSRSRVGVMPDTTLLHLITGHTVRTTSSVDAVLAALTPAALADHGLVGLADAHGHVVYLRPEHVSLVESE